MNSSAIHAGPVIGSPPPPPWVDARTPLGRLIAAALAVEPLRQLLFLQARRMMIRTAETRGIPWRQRREQLRQQAEPLLSASTEAAVVAPPYYRARFHAYAEGNLCWDAACEAEQATDSVALRVWKEEKQLSPTAAQQRMRDGIFAAIEPSLRGPVHDVLDIGCSVGVGTLALADWLEQHGHRGVRVRGLDLSPQMLAVARVRDTGGRITAWHHGAAEATGLPAGSFDLITAQFLCHELPGDATRAVLGEAARLLRPQGVLALVDQDPEAEAIRAMPPALATLLKATEPYLEDYFRLDLPAALAEAGFSAIRRVASDHRHRVLVATRP
ncbi:class I SAM-dependent methyltransferase [Synechococcus sp. BSF8S]|uniref:class I SAM-dependent methyltransferase n=1 Tax=Synechococcales TaxID=1890424 RepID=UPI0016290002|nr:MULTISPECIES: class I SAM-dependent methyltransferase [unclassified Synechococcus]MBC1260438.1 class I SAM-dependent methyltransferase [Synechococcus sp. BSF8S]MBC1263809.1 class I SAM-dependent methyltransferase [Synechococcus sp. BSA11S]